MSMIEPNLAALLWFLLFWNLCCLGFLHLSGMYPIQVRGGQRSRRSVALVLLNTGLWIVLLAGTVCFAYVELRWTTIVVAAGIVFLFVPEAFQALPIRWQDGEGSLLAICCTQVLALGLLAYVGAASIGLQAT
jgi:hypothetical protein